jgi:hypothetical protein
MPYRKLSGCNAASTSILAGTALQKKNFQNDQAKHTNANTYQLFGLGTHLCICAVS